MSSKPTVRGTRLTVEQVLKATGRGLSFEQLKEDFPLLEKAEIMQRILFSFAEQIEGRFCVYQNGRLRIR